MRIGSFPSSDFQFGIPANVAKPKNNKYPLFDSELLALNLSNQDLQDLQSRVQSLYETLRGARDYVRRP